MTDRKTRAVVGLGNPGPRYVGTRHNVGFEVVDALVEGNSTWYSSPHYLHASVVLKDTAVHLVKPTTYMNDSGLAVGAILQRFPIALQDILVLVDDIHLDPGRIRMRRRGSDGGHNGLRSILASVEGDGFPRLRLGIGAPSENQDLIDFVLGRFDESERQAVDHSVSTAKEAIRCWSAEGIETAMNLFNGA